MNIVPLTCKIKRSLYYCITTRLLMRNCSSRQQQQQQQQIVVSADRHNVQNVHGRPRYIARRDNATDECVIQLGSLHVQSMGSVIHSSSAYYALAHRVGALSDDARLTSVCLSRTSGMSRTERPRKTKIVTGVAHVTCYSDTTFKVKKSKVNLQGRGHIMAASRTAYLMYLLLQDSYIPQSTGFRSSKFGGHSCGAVNTGVSPASR